MTCKITKPTHVIPEVPHVVSSPKTKQYNSSYSFGSEISCHNCGKTSAGLHYLSFLVSSYGSKAYVFCPDCGRPPSLSEFIRYRDRVKQLSLF